MSWHVDGRLTESARDTLAVLAVLVAIAVAVMVNVAAVRSAAAQELNVSLLNFGSPQRPWAFSQGQQAEAEAYRLLLFQHLLNREKVSFELTAPGYAPRRVTCR